VFGALGDPTRLAILEQLRAGPVAAGDIAAGFRVSRPAISRHIRVLRQARLLSVRREGRHLVYAIDPRSLRLVHDWLASYRRFWQGRLEELKRFVETDDAP
jgi:DNA-binding transcriptional ArsR family regulator